MSLSEIHNDSERARNRQGEFIRTPEQMEADHKAASLRSRGMTYKRVGEELGVPLQTAHDMVKRAISDIPKEATEELITIELAKIDYLEQRAHQILTKRHAYISAGGKVVYDDGERLEDDGPVLQAITVLSKLADRRAKLLGLNAPTRTELTGKDGGAIELADKSEESKAAVLSLLARLKEAG